MYGATGPAEKGGETRWSRRRFLGRIGAGAGALPALRLKAQPRVRFLTSLEPRESCAIATISIDGMDMAKVTSKLHDDYGIVVSHMKHPKFEGIRIVPNVSNTVREMGCFAESIEEVIKKGLSIGKRARHPSSVHGNVSCWRDAG
jgi:hypothetical protein